MPEALLQPHRLGSTRHAKTATMNVVVAFCPIGFVANLLRRGAELRCQSEAAGRKLSST
jgi:hypothetical protein